ncbi:MAG: GDP-mannose 4,6-dehydratase [Verrucomicrobiota bacterium]
MRILVTGALGFVGRHVLRELAGAGHELLGLDLGTHPGPAPCPVYQADVRDAEAVSKVVREVRPEGCIHLGGIAYVPMGWIDPNLVFSVNLLGAIHLLEAFRQHSPRTRILVVTSAEVYGRKPSDHPLGEDVPLTPSNLYGVSKMAVDLSSLLYASHHGMAVMTARPGNHIGPGQSSKFVSTAFAEQVVRIQRKQVDPVLRVGNLECERDFTDARDVARAYRLLIEKGRPGEAYNIASGKPIRIRVILDELCSLAGIQPRIEVDPERYRPTDSHPMIDSSRIRREVGWTPQIPLSNTLKDILEDIKLHDKTAG